MKRITTRQHESDKRQAPYPSNVAFVGRRTRGTSRLASRSAYAKRPMIRRTYGPRVMAFYNHPRRVKKRGMNWQTLSEAASVRNGNEFEATQEGKAGSTRTVPCETVWFYVETGQDGWVGQPCGAGPASSPEWDTCGMEVKAMVGICRLKRDGWVWQAALARIRLVFSLQTPPLDRPSR